MSQSERFYQLLETMKETHDAKRHDYANDEDVFANFRTCEAAGIPAWKGCCIRIGDKFSRIMGFAKKEKLKVKDERIKDTLIDMANYALIALILYEEQAEEERQKRVVEYNEGFRGNPQIYNYGTEGYNVSLSTAVSNANQVGYNEKIEKKDTR